MSEDSEFRDILRITASDGCASSEPAQPAPIPDDLRALHNSCSARRFAHEVIICDLIERVAKLTAYLAEAKDTSIKLQRHRDCWRRYAYGKNEKPQDFIGGNTVDRAATMQENLQAELTAVKAENAKLRENYSRDNPMSESDCDHDFSRDDGNCVKCGENILPFGDHVTMPEPQQVVPEDLPMCSCMCHEDGESWCDKCLVHHLSPETMAERLGAAEQRAASAQVDLRAQSMSWTESARRLQQSNESLRAERDRLKEQLAEMAKDRDLAKDKDKPS